MSKNPQKPLSNHHAEDLQEALRYVLNRRNLAQKTLIRMIEASKQTALVLSALGKVKGHSLETRNDVEDLIEDRFLLLSSGDEDEDNGLDSYASDVIDKEKGAGTGSGEQVETCFLEELTSDAENIDELLGNLAL